MTDIRKCAVLLVRVSTSTQDYDAQIADLKSTAQEFGYTDFKVIETKETGLADLNNKVGINELFTFVLSNKEFNTVFSTEMSRLGRRQSVLQAVKEWFIDNRIQLFIKDSKFWLLTDEGEMTSQAQMGFTMYSLFAESEILTKKERFLRERKALMEKGISISGKLLFGYERFLNEQKKNELRLHEKNSRVVQEIFNWYLYGFNGNATPSIKAITLYCIKEGYPRYTHSKRNVNKLLKEEAYTGFKITQNKFKNPKFGLIATAKEYIISSSKIKYPQIINRELFDDVQKQLKKNVSKANRDSKHTTLLAKLFKCPNCGRSLSANYRFSGQNANHSYRCTSRSGATPCGGQFSGSMQLYDSAIWSLIKSDWSGISEAIREVNPDISIMNIEKQIANLEERENEINKEIKGIDKVLKSLKSFKDFDFESIDSIKSKLEKFQKEKYLIQNEKLKLENEKLLISNENREYNSIVDNISTIEEDKLLLKQYVNKFINQIEIIEQSIQFTILKVLFKNFGFPFSSVEKPSQKITFLFIDKRITRDIKLYSISDYGAFNADYTSIYKDFLGELLSNENNLDFQIPYNKLDFYNTKK